MTITITPYGALVAFWVSYIGIGAAYLAYLAREHRREAGAWPLPKRRAEWFALPFMILLWPVAVYGFAAGKLR